MNCSAVLYLVLMSVHRCFLPFGYCDADLGEECGKRAVEVGLGGPLGVPSTRNGSVILCKLISAQQHSSGCVQPHLNDDRASDQKWSIPSSLCCGRAYVMALK